MSRRSVPGQIGFAVEMWKQFSSFELGGLEAVVGDVAGLIPLPATPSMRAIQAPPRAWTVCSAMKHGPKNKTVRALCQGHSLKGVL